MANVTAQEQLMLELVNRARLDPLAEAVRQGIDLNQGLGPGTISGTSKQPLAMNDVLVSASRAHSHWMLDTDTFSHTGVSNSDPGTRMSAAGYIFSGNWTWGENIAFSGTTGVIDLSAAIVGQHGGLFRSPGHRTNILEDAFREIGVGQMRGLYQIYDSSMVTQTFARSGTQTFLTGVIYNDVTNDDFYGIGEGTGGVTISAGGSTDTSSAAGGYEIALGAGALTVNLGAVQVSLTIGSSNAKIDLVNGNEIWTSVSLVHNVGARSLHMLGKDNLSIGGSSSAERIFGNSGANTLTGDGGHDTVEGGAGGDILNGGAGSDTLSYSTSTAGIAVNLNANSASGGDAQGDTISLFENLTGSGFNDTLSGNTGSNIMRGGNGNDAINAWHGSDFVFGGLGNDSLRGSLGADRFYFDTALNATTNVDTITDFSIVDDFLMLENAVFTALTTGGTLAAARFAVVAAGGNATTAVQNIVYEQSTGRLFYDADGSSSGAKIHFASVTANTALTAGDFWVY